MYAKSVRITLKPDATIGAVPLAKDVHKLHRGFNLPDSLVVAKALLKGEGWEPDPDDLSIRNDQVDQYPHLNFAIEEVPNPYLEQARKWEEQRALLERAVAGDTAAALEYCRMEYAGEINHGCMG